MSETFSDDGMTGAGIFGRIDRYELIREWTDGSGCTAYLAQDSVSRTEVVIRVLPYEIGVGTAFESVRRSFAAFASLRHPNIVPALALYPVRDASALPDDVRMRLGLRDGSVLMVSAFEPGIPLARWRRQFPGNRIPFGQAVEIAGQIAAAIDYAHGRQCLHLDLIPENVLVETASDGALNVRVCDFAVSARLRESASCAGSGSPNSSGNRFYCAPEQWKGGEAGPSADRYALAVIVYEMLVGEVPFLSAFEMGDPFVAMSAVLSAKPELSDVEPPSAAKALAKALAKTPEDRYVTCGMFVAALSGPREPVSVRPPRPRTRFGGGPAALFFLLFAGASVGCFWCWTEMRGAKAEAWKRATVLEVELNAQEVRLRQAEKERQAAEEAVNEQRTARETVEKRIRTLEAAQRRDADSAVGELTRKLAASERDAEEKMRKEKKRLMDDFSRNEASRTNALMKAHAAEIARLAAACRAASDRADRAEASLRAALLKIAASTNAASSVSSGETVSASSHGETKTLLLPGGVPLELIYVAPGDSVYGDEGTKIRIERGFWLGKYEVSQRQWKSVMGENPSYFKGDDLPVDTVSWDDCQKFVSRVNALQACGARMPTEREWEYACRSGTTTDYSWGNVLNGDQANCDGTYPAGTAKKGTYLKKTVPTGSYAPNPWGFHCMHGNVREWCHDPYDHSRRVLRGGSWYHSSARCRAAARDGSDPASRYSNFGFRLCCSDAPEGEQ